MSKLFYIALAALLAVSMTDLAFASKKWSGYGSSSDSATTQTTSYQKKQTQKTETSSRSTASASDEAIKETVRKYVRERRYRGIMQYNDAGKTRRLEMTGFGNSRIIRKGNSFTIAANFTDKDSGENVLMDFEVASQRDGLAVTKTSLQQGSRGQLNDARSTATKAQNTYRATSTQTQKAAPAKTPEKKKGWW